MNDEIKINDFLEACKKISTHVSRFKDDQVNQLKAFLMKIIEQSYQRRKRSMEVYSDEI